VRGLKKEERRTNVKEASWDCYSTTLGISESKRTGKDKRGERQSTPNGNNLSGVGRNRNQQNPRKNESYNISALPPRFREKGKGVEKMVEEPAKTILVEGTNESSEERGDRLLYKDPGANPCRWERLGPIKKRRAKGAKDIRGMVAESAKRRNETLGRTQPRNQQSLSNSLLET